MQDLALSTGPVSRATLRSMALPDILAPDLAMVFCGSPVAPDSARLGHHFAKPSNLFWRLLHDTGLPPRRFTSFEDDLLPVHGIGLPVHGIGLADLARSAVAANDRDLTAGALDVVGLIAKVDE